MRKVIIGCALISFLFGPTAALLAVALLMNPAAQASCLPAPTLTVENVTTDLTTTTSTGTDIALNQAQMKHAATIVRIGSRIPGVGRNGVLVALTAALAESGLRMLTNVETYPDSGEFANDGDGSDHDSLGMFQMRPSAGWGSVRDLMDPAYQAKAFFGGGSGPNSGSPRGLLDIRGWERLSKGAAAQVVEVSAYPDRYRRFVPVAEKILQSLTRAAEPAQPVLASAESTRVVFPVPEGTWVKTSGYGERIHPVTGQRKAHAGADFAAPRGTDILAAADGIVSFAGPAGGYGNLILIEHTVRGQRVATGYAHMDADSIHVSEGDPVEAGQHIADVGSTGYATGPHLHFEVRPGGTGGDPVDPEPWLASSGAATLTGASVALSGCVA